MILKKVSLLEQNMYELHKYYITFYGPLVSNALIDRLILFLR
jgi:hypothetical protein